MSATNSIGVSESASSLTSKAPNYRWRDLSWPVWVVTASAFVLHFFTSNGYGYFRDELYYLACGEHLAWGYVDQPPAGPIIAFLGRKLFGESLIAIRLLPGLFFCLTILLAAKLAQEFGGRTFSQVTAAICVWIAPVYLVHGNMLSMNMLEVLVWSAGALSIALLVRTGDTRCWLWLGLFAGIGLETKYSITVFGFAILIGLVLTPERRLFASRYFWLSGAIAFGIFLPNLIWNIHYHWPFIEVIHNIKLDGRDIPLGPFQYLVQQIIVVQPATFVFWFAGLVFFLFLRDGRKFRSLGIAYIVAFAVFVISKGKHYYLAPIYPMLMAAGAVAIEAGIQKIRANWFKPALILFLLLSGASSLPLAVPILSVNNFLKFQEKYPIKPAASEKSHLAAALPQTYADEFGWEELTQVVSQAWQQIPPPERAKCGIFATNYGDAGAIDFFGPRYGLPKALSGHQNYWLWGPRGYTGECLIVTSERRARLEESFASVQLAGTIQNPYSLEDGDPVYIVREPKFGTLEQLWPKLKKWR